ncbi:MAG TPA: hypothetical protein PLN21_19915 [Gemmatales bacterium]|nr:hypothetical protein [Gemmatales bacterium]
MFIRRTIIKAAGLLCAFLLIPSWCQAQTVPNARGSYLGGFQAKGQATVRPALIPYIEQDNLNRVSGEIVLSGTIPLHYPILGVINASGACSCLSTNPNQRLGYIARWEKFSYGAGGLFGTGTYQIAGKNVEGVSFFFRSMNLGNVARPDLRGNFAGSFSSTAGTPGTVVAQITDGTSNTFTLNLVFTQNRVATAYASIADVAPDGTLVGMGIGPDGSLAIIRGYIEQDNLLRPTRFLGEVQIKSTVGRPTVVNSIIAILIG